MFNDIKNAIGVIAPALADALGGPLAGAAVTVIGKALGLGESAPAQQVLQHLQQQQMTPAEQLAIQQADNAFKVQIAQIANQNMQVQENAINNTLSDDQNARAMQTDSVNKVRIELVRWLGILTIFVWACTFYLYIKQTVQGDEGYMIGTINAGIIALWGMVVGFYFGTGVDKVMSYFKDKPNAS